MLSATAVVPGRILRTTITDDSTVFTVWSVHNRDFYSAVLHPSLALLRADLALAAERPLSRVVLAAGGWNFEVEGEVSFAMVSGVTQFA